MASLLLIHIMIQMVYMSREGTAFSQSSSLRFHSQYTPFRSTWGFTGIVGRLQTCHTHGTTARRMSTTAPPDTVSISDRTHECLDFQFVLECLKKETVTIMGTEIVSEREAPDHSVASLNYAMVDEISQISGFIPLRTSMNVWPVLRAIEMNSNPPEKEDLASFAENIESIHEVHTFFEANQDKVPLFDELVMQLILPDELIGAFKGSFDDEGNLNADKYTELGRLRKQAEALRARIVQTLQTILRDQDMKEKIADK
jgi:dsDNA-specific endonuclease/ATPase MutS2